MRSRLCGILVCLALVAVSARGDTAAAAGPPLIVGVILSTTGVFATLGEPAANAVRLAEDDINARGGVAGRPLHFEIVDDEGKPDVASQLATQEIAKGAVAIVGGSNTPASAAIVRATTTANTLQIYLSPTAQLWDTKNGVLKTVFETQPRLEIESRTIVRFARERLHAQKIAVLYDDNPYGTQGFRTLDAATKAQGVPLVASVSYPGSATDVTAQLQQIKAAGADTVVIYGASQTPGLAVRQIRALGLKVNVIGSNAIFSDNFLKIAGRDGEDVYSDGSLNFTHPTAREAGLMRAYRARFNGRPISFTTVAWDAAHLVALALANAHGKTAGDALATALETMPPYAGVTGTYHFSATDHNGLAAGDIRMAVDRNAVWFTL
jgi:branched-chain amino acid transport system substrate-binding protein